MNLAGRIRSRYDGALVATLGGIVDRVRERGASVALDDRDRLDGATCMVTGANRGLGLAVAKDLARRGGDVVLACRSGLDTVSDEVRRAAPRASVSASELDLARLSSVERFVERAREDGTRFDVVVLNAGIVPRESRKTPDGLDESFQVNFLANVLLVRRLLEHGLFAHERMPRIVVVSSESHRSAKPIDWSSFGELRPWKMREAVEQYGLGKLLLQTFTEELVRRTRGKVSVHSLCPGAVRTDIGREAPPWAKPILALTMRAFFVEPEKAARPVVHLAASRAIEGDSGIYLHARRRKEPSALARDPELGRRIWTRSEELLSALGHAVQKDEDGR